MEFAGTLGHKKIKLRDKFRQINWGLVLLLSATTSIGFVMLYSAANGSLEPWATRHAVRFGAGVLLMLAVAIVDIRLWLRWAYLGYFVALVLLMAVEFSGSVGMGAQRWVNLGVIQLQPSEIMKIALVVALARYFHGVSTDNMGSIKVLLPPLMMTVLPVALVINQPDLGTALVLLMVSGGMFWLAGIRLWHMALVTSVTIFSVPIGWQFLHDYQRQRILTFLNPETDPLGAGYHILQSKIALGSGGLTGKGFLAGTQSHLDFVPEMQTDFIFAMLAEEFGLLGGLTLLALYALLITYGVTIALRSRNQFGRLMAMGIITTFFVYVFINIAMVMGLIPVVGIPLPLISYGGTSMLTVLIGFGLIMCVHIHRDVWINRRGGSQV